MTQRENLMNAMRRKVCDSVPYNIILCDYLKDKIQKQTGIADFERYLDLPASYIRLPKEDNSHLYERYFDKYRDRLSYIDEWGVGHITGEYSNFSRFCSPMEDFTSPQQVWDFPLPEMLDEKKWRTVKESVDRAHSEGKAAVFYSVQVFEPAWYLRGLNNMLVDMLLNEKMAAACMDRMAGIKSKIAAKAAQSGCDIIIFGDDVGTQKALMMSIGCWREWCKPATKATIDAAKEANPNVLAFYHSDGKIDAIIEDLIGIGVDILNPIQPECMDVLAVKKEYGGRLSFWGGLGTQTTMPFGTPEDVYAATGRLIKEIGCGGGFCVAPSHMLEPEVPVENVWAFLRAVKDFGDYK